MRPSPRPPGVGATTSRITSNGRSFSASPRAASQHRSFCSPHRLHPTRHGGAYPLDPHGSRRGVALGLLVTLTSVGAGAIGVSVLAALYPHLPAKRIVGSDIAHAVPLTLVGGMGHLGLGHVDLALLGTL